MTMLTLALVIWIAAHLYPSVAPASRQQLIVRIGNNAYQGIFSILLIVDLMLIVLSWRKTDPVHLYTPVVELRHPALLLVVIGFILMVAASFPTRIKQVIRHPQLTGVLIWAVAHLLLNGDSRSVLVFTAMGTWTAVSMLTINRRDGTWLKPVVPTGWAREVVMVVVGLIVAAVAVRFHYYLSGVALI